MTQLSIKFVKCPKCGTENKIIYYASINTFMDVNGSQIKKLLEGTLNTSQCKNCGVKIRLSLDVLINCPNGMFYLNPADEFEYKKKQLKNYGLLSKKGEPLTGIESMYLKAKNRIKSKKKYKPSPIPPPAPKITAHTKDYNELFEKLSKQLLKDNKSKEDEKSKIDKSKPKPPPPPPPEN